MVYRINKACAYYPCHRGLQDCTFCYCPFYPCKDPECGSYVTARNGEKVWSCESCAWIHKKKTVDKICRIVRPMRDSLRGRSCGGK